MTDHSVKHSTFTLERTYAAAPAAVFAAWSDRDTKAKWFAAGDGRYSLDFRVGGTEAVHGGDGVDLVARSEFHDIVPDERIVYTYELLLDEARISVSLVTVVFEADGDGTLLRLTEYGAFFDGLEDPTLREQGTGSLLDALGRELA
jgi:uncharacterized protein YndB with AHSA1/START domain